MGRVLEEAVISVLENLPAGIEFRAWDIAYALGEPSSSCVAGALRRLVASGRVRRKPHGERPSTYSLSTGAAEGEEVGHG
jgi:hypothetical protein